MRPFISAVPGKIRVWLILPTLLVAVLGGCKTQDDAAAAAAQMTSTAATLSAYYDTLDKILDATEKTQQANFVIQQIQPADPKIMAALHQQIKLRKDLATEIAKLASLMQQISAADTSTNAATAAASFNAELVTLNAINSNDLETKGVTEATKLLIGFIQMHDEVRAAKQVEPVAHALALFFVSEEREYGRINDGYLTAARQVSEYLVGTDQIDASSLFVAPIAPFNLQLTLTAATKKQAEAQLTAQIGSQYQEKLAASTDATNALADSLGQMDARIAVVSHDHPMKIRLDPVSLTTVQSWIATILKELQP